jgi:hypothetical protein
MADHKSHIALLKSLPREEFERQLKTDLTDSLQELVAAVERAALARGHRLGNCVIDDFQVTHAEMGAQDCRVVLRYSASARRGPGHVENDRISGSAEAVIDDEGRVTYKGITCAEEQAFVPHDVGGGD